MTTYYPISDAQLKLLAYKIRVELYTPLSEYITTVFLCGADIHQKDKIRGKINTALNGPIANSSYDIIYPEEIFDEILYSRKSNLLSLENILAESVDVIIIIPESPGSCAELGAFANDEQLREKIICIIDSKYERKKSFINQGPVKLIKQQDTGRVLYIDPTVIDSNTRLKIIKSIKSVKKKSKKKSGKLSLIQLNNFLLPAIYLLEPIGKEYLQKLVGYANEGDETTDHITIAALTNLQKKKHIELSASGYKLTEAGKIEFLEARFPEKASNGYRDITDLDNFRLEVLNLTLRQKRLRI